MANTSKVPVDPCTETLGMLKSAKYACWAKGSDKFCDKASGCNKLLSDLNAGCKDKTILATAKKDTDMAMKNCPTFDPCAKTKPGEKCSLCEPGDKTCVETEEIKTCQKGRDGSVKCKSYTELKKGIADFTKAGKVTKAFTLATTDLNSVAVKPSNDTSKVKSYSNNIKDMFRELRKADKANKAKDANDKSATIERKDLKRKLLVGPPLRCAPRCPASPPRAHTHTQKHAEARTHTRPHTTPISRLPLALGSVRCVAAPPTHPRWRWFRRRTRPRAGHHAGQRPRG